MTRLEEISAEALDLARFLDLTLTGDAMSPVEAAKVQDATSRLRGHVAWLSGYAASAERQFVGPPPAPALTLKGGA